MPFVPDAAPETKRGRFVPDEPPPVDPIKAWRKENKIEAGVVDFIQGAGGLTKGVLNVLTPADDPSRSDLITGKKPDRGLGDKLRNPVTDEGSGAYFAGQLLDPVAWTTGANAARIMPYAKVLGSGAKNAATALAKNLGMGAATGGAVGALSSQDDVPEDAGRGAIVGALMNQSLPPAMRGVVGGGRFIKELVSPSPARLAVNAAGDKTDEVINALLTQRAATPGVELNAGQASVGSGSAEFAALQRLVDSKAPSLAAATRGRQEAARAAAIQSVGGTPQQLEAAISGRTTMSRANYQSAFGQAVKRDKELRELWKNPFFRKEISDAYELLKAKKLKLSGNYTEFLHFVKEGIDARLSSVGSPGAPAISKAQKAAMMDVKERLLGWLKKHNTSYESARAAHEAASKPINQMELGQELERALVGPTGKERPLPFANAVRKAGLDEDVTGAARIDALTTGQRNVVDAMMRDLTRDETWKTLAREGMDSLRGRVGAPELPPTGFFAPVVSAARSWFNRATGGMTDKGLEELAVLMQRDPASLAVMMRKFTPQQRQAVQTQIERFTLPATGGIVSATEQP